MRIAFEFDTAKGPGLRTRIRNLRAKAAKALEPKPPKPKAEKDQKAENLRAAS